MDRVVETGLKIDLHIHSVVSRLKDGKKVAKNTEENVPLLISKLSENNVNICAITDHDAFSYSMYRALKAAESQPNSVMKVLPGAEFSVSFCHAELEKVLHVVTIFSDLDDEKVKRMERIMQENRPNEKGAYAEVDFLSLLREIDLDTILIVHQKRSLSGGTPGSHDANALGEKKFFEFVNTDYFEALEFRNRRNEVFNRTYVRDMGLEESVRFVTGTDCHDWTIYPSDGDDHSEVFPYTYAKCLPTFRGLVMAMTDHTRLKTGNNSFFCTEKYYLDKIVLKHKDETIAIPLSKGINAIIGDNSVGKSLLLHALTGYRKQSEGMLVQTVVNGYKKHLRTHELTLISKLDEDKVFFFDMQGEVRRKFEEQRLSTTDFLKNYFPDRIDPSPYRKMVENEIDRMVGFLEQKFDLDAAIRRLSSFTILDDDTPVESLIFIKNLRGTKPKTTRLTKLLAAIENAIVSVESILKYKVLLSATDKEAIVKMQADLQQLKKKYNRAKDAISSECDRIETVASVIDKKAEAHQRGTTDISKTKAAFEANTSTLIAGVVNLLELQRKLPCFSFQLSKTPILPHHRKLHDYEFICRLRIHELSSEYMETLLSRVMKKRAKFDWSSVNEAKLKESLLNVDSSIPLLQFLKQEMMKQLDEDLQAEFSIIVNGEDRTKQMSSGINAKTYFDLLSYETAQDGIYIIDQPEDNISQSAIRTYLLNRFKTMGENRQVIMVTHNPQFVVNLDVDNVIYISDYNNHLQYQSGALEYSCPEYDILDIVARSIDGGLESIRKRWKRYEKANEV